ncbi:MAG: hypothetical protein ITG02_02085 [Patulibacter sp.]|nr:hypothetical protein [Patulibacter sp.]
MPQNHGPRARPWANVPLPQGPWAPFLAVAAVLATVALVAQGPRIGGDPPTVPDGRAFATADAVDARASDDAGATAVADASRDVDHAADRDVPRTEPDAGAPAAASPRPRRRAVPASSHRQRRSAAGRPRTGRSRGGRRAPTPPPAPRPVRATAIATDAAAPPVRRPSAPHRPPAVGSAEQEFGAP